MLQKSETQNRNYQKELDKLLTELTSALPQNPQKKPSLLLHACCGPCSSYVLEYLTNFFSITVFYYNPNIYPPEEYHRRFEELKSLYTRFPPALEGKVQVVEKAYEPQEFYQAIGIAQNPELAAEPEKGERCRRCYELRLRAAYDYACKNHFDYYCTTLSISPFKDAQKINVIGEALASSETKFSTGDSSTPANSSPANGISTPKWLPSDFKKKGGFKRSLEISTEYNLYRQDYCGCVYSKNNVK